MKIKFKATAEQIELVKQMGSKDATIATPAQEAFAAFLGPVIQKVLMGAGTASMIYKDFEFNEDDTASFPLDLYYNQDAGYIQTWSQTIAGGLPSSQVEGISEMKIATFKIDSAVSASKKYARKSRLDVVTGMVQRMANEVLIRQERNAYAVVMKAAAEASTLNGRGSTDATALKHVIRGNTAGVFLVDDLSKLILRFRRINVSYANTTPDGQGTTLTDLLVSPEIKAQIRGFAYNPMNTRQATSGTTSITLPDNIREGIYKNVGTQEIFGINITDLVELGIGQKYNTLFSNSAGTTAYTKVDGTGSATFSGSTEEILVGLDLNADLGFVRAIAVNGDSGATFTTIADDQYVLRQDKMGFYGSQEIGLVCAASKVVGGLIV